MRPFDSGPLLSPPSSSLSTETDTPVVEYQRCRKFRQLSTKSTTTKESQKPSSEGDQEGEEKVASSGPVVNQVCFFFSFLEFDSFFFTLIVFFFFLEIWGWENNDRFLFLLYFSSRPSELSSDPLGMCPCVDVNCFAGVNPHPPCAVTLSAVPARAALFCLLCLFVWPHPTWPKICC